MNKPARIFKTETQMYTLIGAVFGLLFPILASYIQISNSNLPYSFSSFLAVQSSDSLLWIIDTAPFFLGLFAYIAGKRQDSSRKLNEEVNKVNSELQAMQTSLEQTFRERTAFLSQRNYILQTISDFARFASNLNNEEDLLDQSTQMIAERLKLEHVNIYLVDEAAENAILCSSNSQVGKSLISNRYRLRIYPGERVSNFSETESLHFQVGGQNIGITRPVSLPDTKTNLSFPLITGQKLIGMINAQTISSSPEYLEKGAFQTLADQFALSLQNIRLLVELQANLREISQMTGKTVKGSWERILGGGTLGFDYDRLHVLPTGESFSKEMTEKLLAGQSVTYLTEEDNSRARLVAPIILRDEVIGVIGYEDEDPQHEWQSEEKVLLETIASRVSLALENSRLLAEAQQRAERERIVGHVTGRIRETLDIDTVLRTAVQEMRQSLGLRQAEVRLQPLKETEGKKA